MKLLFNKTVGKDVRNGLLMSLLGFPVGAMAALVYEIELGHQHAWVLFVVLFVVALIYNTLTEFVSQFVTSVVSGLTLGLGAALIVKDTLITPSTLGLEVAGIYYTAFLIIFGIRRRHGTLPL